MTLCMLSLHTEDQKQRAKKLMLGLEPEIRKILCETKLNLKKLGFFEAFHKRNNDKYKRKYARILYLNIEQTEAYQCVENLLDFLVKKFIDEGLLKEDQLSHLRFDKKSNKFKGDVHHITVMRARSERGFPVEDIMDNLASFSLGVTEIKTVDLSTRFQYGEDGFYLPLHRVHLKNK